MLYMRATHSVIKRSFESFLPEARDTYIHIYVRKSNKLARLERHFAVICAVERLSSAI